jgi:hypothetical protein
MSRGVARPAARHRTHEPREPNEERLTLMVNIGKPGGGGGGGTSGYDRNEHLNHLVAYVGNEDRPDVQTRHGVTRAAWSEYVVCLTDNVVFRDHLTFGAVIVPQILDGTEGIVLGTLGKGDASAGKSAAWVLFDPSDEELAEATEWFAKYSATLPSGRIVIEMPPPAGADEAF